ncbi:MAG TPA: hypothetical protein VG734_23400 [Lacunisphaera sp.]|nr:hypothetical protein [Lacunisphaera sp.]
MICPIPRARIQPARLPKVRTLVAAGWLVASAAVLPAQEGKWGLFTGRTDIGAPQHSGAVAHDAASGTYTVSGGGANMWFNKDSFHFVWKQVDGDIGLEADLAFQGTGGDPHRKGILMVRQSLDADAAYADVAVHGDGLTSLQFRESRGDLTREVQALLKTPKRVRLDRVGDYVYMSLAGEDGVLKPNGSSAKVPLKAPFYVGIGVCSHNDAVTETVVFSKVAASPPAKEVTAARSSLEYIKIPSGDRVCVYPSVQELAGPKWQDDGSLHYSVAHPRYTIRPEANATPKPWEETMGMSAWALSPDGKWKASFERDIANGDSSTAVLTLQPTAGGSARVLMRLPDQKVSPMEISWSTDSTKIAYIRSQPAPAAN